ncbi:MAG: AAA family ATPase [Gemmatimonadetes bacterium]|nr:AAA family ATPase [Gemmatimonadota bacterium]
MKLRRLHLHGFKSFADRTELEFHDGVTAIVGPNGCGKSNISDAIRWVLGEQRASAIRGSKMEEAIFQGTTHRRALSRAEVSLVFSNDERRLALPHDEIEIRRTIFREGGSEYALNRSPCRLRDIYDLFRDTGLGTNAYAVIEQGMVDSILSDRAEERRQMFEEAAGIGRYKDRRKAAQRRLEGAEADLARLEDLVAEVDSKVRSLARQSRRAQRYQELRARRLDLEVALAAGELEEARRLLSESTERLERLARDEPAERSALAAVEAELERVRLEAAEAGRARGEAAGRHAGATRRIAERERELAVAEERRAGARRRIEQIALERDELLGRIGALEAELLGLDEARARCRDEVRAGAEHVAAIQARQAEIRLELARLRREEEAARQREADRSRRRTELEAEAVAAEAVVRDAEARLAHLAVEDEALAAEFARLDEQGDLFEEQTRDLVARKEAALAEVDRRAEELEALRAAEQAARRELAEAEERAGKLAARVAALEALEREHHGFAPAVAAALAARDELRGLDGPLAERLQLPPERAAAVEGALASLLQVLVVEGDAAAAGIEAWLAGRPDRGLLALLPAAELSRVEALLEAFRFVGTPPAEPVLLGRRERLEALRREAAAAAAERDARAAARAALAEQLADGEARLQDARSRLHELDLQLRRTEAEGQTHSGQRSRAERTRAELERRRAELSAAIEAGRERARRARTQREELDAAEAGAGPDVAANAEALAAVEASWERARDEEAEARVAHARSESELASLDRRIVTAADTLEEARRRAATLDREEAENRRMLEQLARLATDAGAELEGLFAARDAAGAELRALDERIEALAAQAEALEAEARALRRRVEERGEDRHRLELQRAEAEAAERRVVERLEAEWGRPFAQLRAQAAPVDLDPDALRAELKALAVEIERLGPVNMLAIEEHEEERRRLEFLTAQRDDLVQARDDLRTAIRQINRTARQLFMETFEQIRRNFHETFGALFEGGECDIWLADPEDPLECDIEIAASPRGKRTQRIHLLSGGERALTALALLFAIYLVKPSPFCVLDEVDAPLDEANIGRFIAMLERFKAGTQFIVITHNPRTMEAADWMYGVTMEEPGISTIVGVQLDDALRDSRLAAKN